MELPPAPDPAAIQIGPDARGSPYAPALGPEFEGLTLRSMEATDISAGVDLISRAMNSDEGAYAQATFDSHFGALTHGVDDGRDYYVLTSAETIVGLVGLHWYSWGPAENVWLSWFAVDPQWYGRGLGKAMLGAIGSLASAKGYRKFFIETYSTPEFAHARRLYESAGFRQAGGIQQWLPNGADMVVYYKPLIPNL